MPDNPEIKRALSQGIKSLMSEMKFEDITVADICKASAVSRRSFYRYFQDKYALLNYVHYDDYCRFFDEKKTSHAWELFPSACAHLYENRKFYLNAFDVTGPGAFREFCIERLRVYLERDFGAACKTESEREFYITRVLNAVFDALQIWLSSEPCMPPEEFVEHTMRSVSRFSALFAANAIMIAHQMGIQD